jgi:cell filamentation protein
MVRVNKINITNQVALVEAEERLSKLRATQIFDTCDIDKVEVVTFAGLAFIHHYLFSDVYAFAFNVRDINIAKGNFRFGPLMYLEPSLTHIDAMPQSTFDKIVEKYVEMGVAHPFREGNGRATRLWLDLMLTRGLHLAVDWNQVDKKDYTLAMQRSPVKTLRSRFS